MLIIHKINQNQFKGISHSFVGKDNTSIQHDKINRTKEWNTQEKQTPDNGEPAL